MELHSQTAPWPVLHEAQRTVLLEVLVHGSRSRSDLARRTGLSRTSLMRLSRDLVDLGLVTEGETSAPNGRGRPSEMLQLRPEAAQFAGFKLTGEALYAAVTDLKANVLEIQERPLLSREVPDVVDLIGEIVSDFGRRHPRLVSVGVCLAGDVEEVRGRPVVVGSHFLGWAEVPLGDLVEQRTGLPTAVANDVQALTAAHHWFGAGVGRSSLAVIGLGAGIGAGIVVNNELVKGARGHPGKVGHIPVRSDGPECDRGHRGCASAFVTIPAVLANAHDTSLEHVIARAEADDPVALLALDQAGFALGAVVAQIVNTVDPEKVVITGEGLAIPRMARASMELGLATHRDPASEPAPIEVYDFRFADYAWAAAINAIRHIL